MIAKTVHILFEGRALCGLPGLPKDWPEGHVWIAFDDPRRDVATCPVCTQPNQRVTSAPFTYSPGERDAMLRGMRAASDRFYESAVRIGCHPFIEFAGLMNEYIKVCERAHKLGVDFTESSAHSGKPLDMRPYEAAYLGEKLGCIYGPSLQAPENLRAFSRAAGLDGEPESGRETEPHD